MKLYHINAEGWQLPGKQSKGAERVEVPTAAPALCAWLNARRVPRDGIKTLEQLASEPPGLEPFTLEGYAATQLASDRDHILGPPTKDPPRVSPAFLGDLASGAEFVPVAKAAEIDRLLERCPKCHGGAAANVLAWIPTASLDDLQSVAEAIRRHVAELGEELAERTVQ